MAGITAELLTHWLLWPAFHLPKMSLPSFRLQVPFEVTAKGGREGGREKVGQRGDR